MKTWAQPAHVNISILVANKQPAATGWKQQWISSSFNQSRSQVARMLTPYLGLVCWHDKAYLLFLIGPCLCGSLCYFILQWNNAVWNEWKKKSGPKIFNGSIIIFAVSPSALKLAIYKQWKETVASRRACTHLNWSVTQKKGGGLLDTHSCRQCAKKKKIITDVYRDIQGHPVSVFSKKWPLRVN